MGLPLQQMARLRVIGPWLTVLCCFGLIDGQAQQSRRAVPVDDEPPVPKAVPLPADGRLPAQRPAGQNQPKPTGPDADLFDYATMLYERKEHALAAQSYSQYLQRYPGGAQVALCLFRLGECFVNQNDMVSAERYYLEVVNRYPSSEGAPSAAYRLGAIRFNGRQFEESAKYFSFCESRTTFQQIKLAAAYNKSRAYQMAGDHRNMMAALEAVVAVKTDNPYRESALLSLATALLAGDRKKEALSMFLDLIESSQDKIVVSDATVKAAVIEAESGKPDEAIGHFEAALKMPETTPENRGVALVGTVQALYAKGDYNAVIDAYNRNASVLPSGDLRPKMLLLVGNAHRMRKTYSRAVELYLLIEKHHQDTEQAFEAGYWKLYCFYLLGDKNLPEFARAFLERYTASRGDHEFITLARLILADSFFNALQYKEAADEFANLEIKNLPEKLRAGSLFNKGWAEAEAGRHLDATGTLTKFVTDYPKHEYVPKALARRGLSYREIRDIQKAQDDFSRVIKDFEGNEAVELALLQRGLIHMELREVKQMIADFEALVTKFPNSAAAAQAYFGTGRGYFELKQFDKAIAPLQKAVELDKTTYLDRASPTIIYAYYGKQDSDGLAKAVDAYRETNPDAVIPPNVLGWLGITLFNKADFARAARFLTYATVADALNTPVAIWDYLGRAWLELKRFEQAMMAIDKFLENPPDMAAKARGLLTKSRALLGLNRFAEADQVAKEGLQIVKDGKLQAQLLIHEGDIFFAEGEELHRSGNQAAAVEKWRAAAGRYVVPSQMFVDPEITPEALYKAARALERSGQRDKAEQLLRQLKDKYPEYAPAA